jgi:hypothetical protein
MIAIAKTIALTITPTTIPCAKGVTLEGDATFRPPGKTRGLVEKLRGTGVQGSAHSCNALLFRYFFLSPKSASGGMRGSTSEPPMHAPYSVAFEKVARHFF